MNETILYLPGLSPVENKDLCARFDGGRLSSDGGVLVLRGIRSLELGVGLVSGFGIVLLGARITTSDIASLGISTTFS